jgi:NADH-quinone oxidoreductase subunit H
VTVGLELFQMLVFPGLLFLVAFGMAGEFIDRKLYARMQNRQGPPWFQPLADLIKLFSKEEVIPAQADRWLFKLTPMVALAATVTAFLYIPIWSHHALFSFEGDAIVVLYLLTIPTVCFFLGGWYSRSVFSMLGAVRSLMQMFAYEIPLFLSILGPSMLARSWSLSVVSAYYVAHPAMALVNVIGLVVSLVALLGKLERVPFDIPEAETEIVAGSFTEYSGRLFGIFRLAINVEMMVGASLIAAVFFPFGMGAAAGASGAAAAGFALYLVKVLAIVAVMTLMRTLFARFRIDQMISFCWLIAAPAAFVQLVVNLVVKELTHT